MGDAPVTLSDTREFGTDGTIVFVTARDSLDDKIKGLTVGGDDYVTKPFSLEEVVARIRAVLRRTRGEADDSNTLRFHDLELDEVAHLTDDPGLRSDQYNFMSRVDHLSIGHTIDAWRRVDGNPLPTLSWCSLSLTD